jgi:hypothetical protein
MVEILASTDRLLIQNLMQIDLKTLVHTSGSMESRRKTMYDSRTWSKQADVMESSILEYLKDLLLSDRPDKIVLPKSARKSLQNIIHCCIFMFTGTTTSRTYFGWINPNPGDMFEKEEMESVGRAKSTGREKVLFVIHRGVIARRHDGSNEVIFKAKVVLNPSS